MKSYPEMRSPLGNPPKDFPETCPGCGALRLAFDMSPHLGYALYDCAPDKTVPPFSRWNATPGAYVVKDQCQNHTQKWWGYCLRDEQAEAGLKGSVTYMNTTNGREFSRDVDALAWIKRNKVFVVGGPKGEASEVGKSEAGNGGRHYWAKLHNADHMATGRFMTVWFQEERDRDVFLSKTRTLPGESVKLAK